MELNGYSVRPLAEADLEMVLAWRNAPRVHSHMITDHTITLAEHRAWFARQQGESPTRHLIFMAGEEPIGYIGYIDNDLPNRLSISVYRGVLRKNPLDGIYIYVLAAMYGFEVLGLDNVDCETFTDNVEALTVSRYVGYRDVRVVENYAVKGGKSLAVQLLTMTRAEWQQLKAERFC